MSGLARNIFHFALIYVFISDNVFNMKTIQQYKIAEWLGVKPGTLSNIFCDNRRPGRRKASHFASITGISFKDWMLSDGNQLREKVFKAWSKQHGEKS